MRRDVLIRMEREWSSVFGEPHMREQKLENEKKLAEVFNKAAFAPTGETKVAENKATDNISCSKTPLALLTSGFL